MKDGSTRMAHKFEQAVDLETGAACAVTVQSMDGGDTASLPVTLDEAERQLAAVEAAPGEVVADTDARPPFCARPPSLGLRVRRASAQDSSATMVPLHPRRVGVDCNPVRPPTLGNQGH